jgi:hypothetical protein
MGNGTSSSSGTEPEHIFVFSLVDGDSGPRLEGVVPKKLRGEKTLLDLVFGSVPLLKKDSCSFKLHLLHDVLLCSFISGRSSAVCVAFTELSSSTLEGVLVHWDLLWAGRGSLGSIARIVLQHALRRFDTSTSSPAVATSTSAVAVELVLRDKWPLHVRLADCPFAAAVMKMLEQSSSSSRHPPKLFVSENKEVAAAAGVTAQRIAASAKCGSGEAVRAQARAASLRVEVMERWGSDSGRWRESGGCAADGIARQRECYGFIYWFFLLFSGHFCPSDQ